MDPTDPMADPLTDTNDKENTGGAGGGAGGSGAAARKEKCPDREADFQGWLQFQKAQVRGAAALRAAFPAAGFLFCRSAARLLAAVLSVRGGAKCTRLTV